MYLDYLGNSDGNLTKILPTNDKILNKKKLEFPMTINYPFQMQLVSIILKSINQDFQKVITYNKLHPA